MSVDSLDERKFALDKQKAELDREKFEFDKASTTHRQRFLNANFGVVITAVVSVATITVSGLQLYNTWLNNRSISQLEHEKFDANGLQSDRAFKMAVAGSLLERTKDFNTQDPREALFLRQVVVSLLPDDVAKDMVRKLADSAPSDELRDVWNDAKVWQQLSDQPPPDTSQGATLNVAMIVEALPRLKGSEERLQQLLDAAQEAGFSDQPRLVLFLANVIYESGDLRVLEENLNYSSVARITSIFPRIDAATAAGLVHNERGLANAVYGGRLGNTEPEDGYTFRGRGYFQTTGRSAYSSLSKLIGIDLVANPDLLSTPEVAAKAAAMFFLSFKAMTTTILGSRRALTGAPMTGVSQVQANYDALAAARGQTPASAEMAQQNDG